MTYGTEPMPESTLKAMHKILPNVRLKQTYGLSELGIMPTKSEDNTSLYMKLGGDGFETKIVDDILYIRAKSAMLGYLNAPSPFDKDGWFNTKDKVEKYVSYQTNNGIKDKSRVPDKLGSPVEQKYLDADLNNEISDKLLTWLPDIVTRPFVATATIALIPLVLKNIFHLEKVKNHNRQKILKKI